MSIEAEDIHGWMEKKRWM